MVNYCSRNFLKLMMVIILFSNNMGNKILSGHLLSPNEFSCPRIELHSDEI